MPAFRFPAISSELNPGNISPTESDAPAPVEQHVASLNALIDDLVEEDATSNHTVGFMYEFANRHDAGYSTPISVLQDPRAQRIVGTILDETGATSSFREIADYIGSNAGNYLAARVVGHGVLGLVQNTLTYEARGWEHDRALGMATVMSAHHPGFPITMVSGFLSGNADIPPHLRSGLFIDNNGSEPEVMRSRLIEVAAAKLHIPTAEVAKAAVLGYALDRITPGRIPDAIHILDDGSVRITGGEVIQKKYGLVANDLLRDEANISIGQLYTTVIERLNADSDAAVQAAEFAGQPQLIAFISAKAQSIITQTHTAQMSAFDALREQGFTDSFSQLSTERNDLLQAARTHDDPNLRFALATYDTILAATEKR
jgi:hypothetical protein